MPTYRFLFPLLASTLLWFAEFSHAQDSKPASASTDVLFVIPDSDDAWSGQGPIRRTDRFRQIWNSRRTEFMNSASTEKNAVVFLGDSITQGWGGRLATSFPGIKVANRGIGGDTTRGMLNRLQEDVLSLDPSCVVLLMGTNDLEENAEPETIASNAKEILDRVAKHDSKTPVILCLVLPSNESKNRPSAKIKQLNLLYSNLAKGYPQVFVLDTWSLFANEAGDATEADFKDLLHLNAPGYSKWAAALQPALATFGFTETEDDSFQPEEGFELLFNGKDLTGWGYHPTSEKMIKMIENWKKRDPSAPTMPILTEPVAFDGLTQSPDGRYVAKHGRLIVTAPIEGRRIQQLWTTKTFDQDFELRLEFRALPMADSGVFIREPQLQCRDYITAGPYKDLKSYRPQQWNELVVVVKDNVAHCTCNGEVLEASLQVPSSGPIGLEGDRGQMEYRRIRIK